MVKILLASGGSGPAEMSCSDGHASRVREPPVFLHYSTSEERVTITVSTPRLLKDPRLGGTCDFWGETMLSLCKSHFIRNIIVVTPLMNLPPTAGYLNKFHFFQSFVPLMNTHLSVWGKLTRLRWPQGPSWVDMVAHAFNPSTWEAQAAESVSSRSA